MINISTFFKLNCNQHKLDFVDVKLDDDNELFIDPRLIEVNTEPRLKEMSSCLRVYSSKLIKGIITKDKPLVKNLLSGLGEPIETRLGFGWGNSNGKSIGSLLKPKFELAILNNDVITNGKINHWSDLELIVDNFNCDRISDMTTKVIKSYLIEYTQIQCKQLGIPIKEFRQRDIFDPKNFTWETKKVQLPFEDIEGMEKEIIFVPKSIVRRQKDANSNLSCFYRYAVEHYVLHDSDYLKDFPKNGKNNTVLKKDIRKSIKDVKERMTEWILKYKNLLNDYKSYFSKEKLRQLSDEEISEIVYTNRFLAAA